MVRVAEVRRRRSERGRREVRERVFGSAGVRFPEERNRDRGDSKGRIGEGRLFGEKPAEELVVLLYLQSALLLHVLCFLAVHRSCLLSLSLSLSVSEDF